MKCSEMEDFLSAYANGEISGHDKQVVEEHIAACEQCRFRLSEYSRIKHDLDALRSTQGFHSLSEAAMAAIGRRQSVKRSPWLRPLAVAVPVAVVVLVGLLVWQPWTGAGQENGIFARVRAAAIGLQYYKADNTRMIDQGGLTRTVQYTVEFAAPDQYHIAVIEGNVSGDSISIGRDRYEWGQQPEAPDFKMTGISGVIASAIGPPTREDSLDLIESLQNLEKLPDEVIDGVLCYHYRGQVDRLQDSTPAATATLDPVQQYIQTAANRWHEWARSWQEEGEFWIGRDDYLLRQEKRTTYIPPFGPQDQACTLQSTTRYYDFDIPVTVEPPLSADGQLQPGWTLDERDYSSDSRSLDSIIGAGGSMTIDIEDSGRQQIKYTVTLMNRRDVRLSDVRVLVYTITRAGQAMREEMEMIPDSGKQVDLNPGERTSFSLSWSFLNDSVNDQIDPVGAATDTVIRYFMPDGTEVTETVPRSPAFTSSP